MFSPLTLLPLLAASQQSAAPATQDIATRLADLERQVSLLNEELFQLEHGEALMQPEAVRWRALAPAASKVYGIAPGATSLGGYGEMLYNDPRGGASNQLDFLRAIVYFGADLSDGWIFNSELEVEHATLEDNNDGSGETAPGELSLEFAYLEKSLTDHLAARAGLLLIPMGFINELHEPTTFLSANRPEVERVILPSTWSENGAGLLGGNDAWSWRAYVVNGFDAGGFSAAGIRGGRQKGALALAEDFAVVGRLDYQGQQNLTVGVSGYYGNAGQGQAGFSSTSLAIADLHADWRPGDLRVRALGAISRIGDVEQLNLAQSFTGSESVGEEQQGWYLEVGYDLKHALEMSANLVPFLRHEDYDTQAKVPDGFSSDPANDRSNWTYGVFWQPTPQVAIKFDYLDADNGADSAEDLLRLSIGYIF